MPRRSRLPRTHLLSSFLRRPSARVLPAVGVTALLALTATLSPTPALASGAVPRASSHVQVTFVTGDLAWTRQARAAVQAAASTWEQAIASPVPITVRATAGTIGGNTLAYAIPASFVRNRGASPGVADDVFEPVALANSRLGRDAAPKQPDIEARFDLSRTDLYLGTDGRTPAGSYDLESLALHEFGHGLAFTGSAGFGKPASLGRKGTVGTNVIPGSRTPFSYDRFTCVRRAARCVPLMSLTDGSTQLSRAFQSNALYWSGRHATAANCGRPVRLHAPAVLQPGASYVHMDEATYPSRDALMTPFLFYGQTTQTIGPLVKGMMADMGWRIRVR